MYHINHVQNNERVVDGMDIFRTGAKAGDIIFFESDGSPQDIFIRLVSKDYTHIGVITEDGRMIDASALGVFEREIPTHVPFRIMRLKGATDKDLSGIISEMRSHTGEKYSFTGAVFAGILRLLGLKTIANKIDKKWFCSEIVVYAIRKETKIKIVVGFVSDNVLPTDIAKDDNLEDIYG